MKDPIGERFSLLFVSLLLVPVYAFQFIKSFQPAALNFGYGAVLIQPHALPMFLALLLSVGTLIWGLLIALELVHLED